MSKIDQLRRQREAQHARQQGEPASAAKIAPVEVPVTRRASAVSDATEGKCAVCGKVRELHNGLVSSHQKGLGKMCPGSRKEPA